MRAMRRTPLESPEESQGHEHRLTWKTHQARSKISGSFQPPSAVSSRSAPEVAAVALAAVSSPDSSAVRLQFTFT